jgi:BirA family transcriptional regulator, biotin operon repressor / biotin---[acetyl-CoA-carboxylase] ligase
LRTVQRPMEGLASLIRGNFVEKLVFLETVESTNTLAMELGDRNASHGTVVIAESQIHGRGRLGREWASPPSGNIYMSILLRPNIAIKDAALLTLLAAVASARALRKLTALNIEIKWPNDLMASGRKLGGILTETKTIDKNVVFAVLGIGINVNMELKDLPEEMREIATSIMHETKREHHRTMLLASILKEIDSWYAVFLKGGKEPLLSEWKRLSSTLGKIVCVETGKETLVGLAEDIDGNGRLLLKLPSGQVKRISSGDIKTVR